MSGFTESALEKKLAELNSSQQSIQTLSLWLIHHRKHHKTITQVWFKELRKAKPNRKLTFMYLCNDVIQNSKKKGPEFSREFSTVLSKAFTHVSKAVTDDKTKSGLERIINIWEERNVYDNFIIEELRESMVEKKKHATPTKDTSIKSAPTKSSKSISAKSASSKQKSKASSDTHTHTHAEKRVKTMDIEPITKKKKTSLVKEELESGIESPPGDPPETDVLIKALQDLENSPSTDAEVREKIASLPPEVSDISLLEKIQCREAAEKLAKQVEEACVLLADYNGRLSEELDNRKQISKMLSNFVHSQRELVTATERKIEEYRDKLKRVSQVRSELKSHLQNLPDLTLLPSVTGGLAPLPSAGDLFNM